MNMNLDGFKGQKIIGLKSIQKSKEPGSYGFKQDFVGACNHAYLYAAYSFI